MIFNTHVTRLKLESELHYPLAMEENVKQIHNLCHGSISKLWNIEIGSTFCIEGKTWSRLLNAVVLQSRFVVRIPYSRIYGTSSSLHIAMLGTVTPNRVQDLVKTRGKYSLQIRAWTKNINKPLCCSFSHNLQPWIDIQIVPRWFSGLINAFGEKASQCCNTRSSQDEKPPYIGCAYEKLKKPQYTMCAKQIEKTTVHVMCHKAQIMQRGMNLSGS